MLRKARQRHVDRRRGDADLLLLEGGEQGIAAGIGEGALEGGVTRRVGSHGEVDVECHAAGAERHQRVEQPRMHAARPWPHAHARKTCRVDIDEDDGAAGGRRREPVARAAQRIVERREQPQQHSRHQQQAAKGNLQHRQPEDLQHSTQDTPRRNAACQTGR